MIYRYNFGDVIETSAVVGKVSDGKHIPYFTVTESNAGSCFEYELGRDDIVYGLGETMRGINKRGGRYVSFNSDNMRHTDKMPSMYGSHNFIIVDGKNTFGAFFDTPARVVFDIDYYGSGKMNILCEQGVAVYIIDGDNAYDIARQFLNIIGQSYLPPLWAFGYGQSRWGYKNEGDVREVVAGYKEAGMPLDYVCLDIDYMQGYADFTVDKSRFPDMAGFIEEMKGRGVRFVPIVDAGIKIEPGNPVYEEGVKKGYFCKNLEGDDFCAAVWPGMTHFPDFMQAEAREWFGRQYKFYTDLGFEGFWNDMNEPAIFYSQYTKGKKTSRNCGDGLYKGGAFLSDYRSFTHSIGGKMVNHWNVHNLYGFNMTRASSEGLENLLDKRFLIFSRSSYIGAHRYGGIWTGDNKSSWHMFRRNVTMMPGLNMCGFLYSGADTGGYSGNAGRRLLLRWLAFSVFTSLMRNHSTKGTRRQECYKYTGATDFKSILSLRYRLLPYIYSEFMKTALTRDMYIKPLAFGYPNDARARNIEDQLLVGDSIMIAPVLSRGNKRKVYIPERMTEVRWNGREFITRPVGAGESVICVPLGEVVFYIRSGKLLPVGHGGRNTGEVNLTEVELLGDGAVYEQYIDDGITRDCTTANIRTLTR